MNKKENTNKKELKKDNDFNYSGVGFGYFTDPNSIILKLMQILSGKQK